MKKDRIQQVKTTREKHGEDHYKKIGQKGGANSPTKFTSETGSANAKKRWNKKDEEVSNG
jgi:hypothetical protein